jgi:hypothetical protein
LRKISGNDFTHDITIGKVVPLVFVPRRCAKAVRQGGAPKAGLTETALRNTLSPGGRIALIANERESINMRQKLRKFFQP